MSSVIEDLKQLEDRVLARIAELESCVAELEQLREVAARLGLLDAAWGDSSRATNRATATASTTATPRVPATAGRRRAPARARAGRPVTAAVAQPPTRSSTRRERVLEVVGGEPGISVREIVAQLGVNRTSLYPVVRQLVSDGLLHKDGRGLWPATR
jgi:hypothetical protein